LKKLAREERPHPLSDPHGPAESLFHPITPRYRAVLFGRL
jgi:hypothetical protein